MTSENIKQRFRESFVLQAKFSSNRLLKKDLERHLFNIKNKVRFGKDLTVNEKWLSENHSILTLTAKSIDFHHMLLSERTLNFLDLILEDKEFEGKREEVFTVFEAISSDSLCSEKELGSVRGAFFLLLIKKISKASESLSDELPRLLTLMHALRGVDFDGFAFSFSPLEKLLRFDPAGIYPKMTRPTQMLYKQRIKKEAKRKKVTPETLCKEKLRLAEENQLHIGFFLQKKRKNSFYFPALFVLFFFLLMDFVLMSQSVLLSLFLAIPLYFFCKKLFDFIFSLLYHNEILPQMRIENVTKDQKTVVAITTLITSEKDIDLLCQKIHRFQVNNFQSGDQIYFGLICDLCEASQAESEKDTLLFNYLQEKINQLNEKEEVYFAFLRKRVYHESENKYVGWERKRGAIDQFVSFLSEGKLEDACRIFGKSEVLVDAKYLITLDADTELGIQQAKRLIGICEHPFHKVKIQTVNGKKKITAGFGIIQPKITSSLLQKIATPFGKIYGNGSGEILYASASFDTMQSLFHEGNFCGKGILSVSAYQEVMHGVLPEQKILSHDMPEGALLRCALATNEYFVDSDPQNTISYYKRQHRWIRGDIQNLSLLKLFSPMRKWFCIENVLRYFLPISEILLLAASVFYAKPLAMICTLLVVLFHAQSFFITLTGIILSGNYEHFNRHFSTKMRNLILNSFYQSFLSLSSMAFECIYFSDAIIRSAYRILFSKKKTLEWQVYSPFAKSKFPILFYLPSLIFSVLFLLFFQNQLTVFLAASWLVFPLISIQISKPYAEKKGWTEKEKDLFRKMARKEFRFFEECVGKSTHHLPPDNIQLEPIEKIAMRTSPTNIGLYLASLASARDFEFITTQILCQKVKKTLETLSKLERFHGHLYNWYDLNTLNVIGDRFVSTVDSGNYVAGLVVLRQALKEYESEDSQIREIIDQLDEEIGRTNFAVLFHHERNLFRVGVVPDEVQKSSSDYDHYMSEARITSFLAIAMGQVSATHWRHLSRPLLSFYGRVGVGSWSGTGFEYFMAPLFLPVIENSLEDESLEYACFCQKKVKGCFNEKDHVFGISESGYALTDHNGNYQYKAFGVPFLSIQGKEEIPKVISPYTSFLMLERKDRAILRNLELLEKNGLCGVYGFFESCEFHSNFSGDFTPVYSYMSHHKGMSILALAGAVFDKKNVDRFLSFCDFSAKVELLAERFPIEAKIAKKRKIYRENSLRQNFPPQLQTVTKHPETGCLLTDGKMTLLFYNNGQNRVLYQEMDLFDYQKGGIFCTVYLGEEAYLFSYEKNSEQKVLFGNDFVEHSITRGKKSVHLRFELISGKNAFLVRLEVHGHFGKSRVEFYFDATLQYEKEYRAHPAFQSLSLEGKSDGKSLVIRRRGVEEHRYLSVESPFPFQTKLSEREAEKVFGYQMLYRPEVLLNFDFERSENICLPLIFSYSQKEKGEDLYQYLDGSFLLTDKLKKIGQERMRRLEEICCYDDDCREAEKNFLPKLLQKRRFLVGNHVKMIPRDALWKYGISGDDPIISFYFDAKNEEQFKTIKIFIRIFKKLRISGLCIDLVILHPGSEEYFDPVREKLTDLISQYRCEFLLGKHPGIHFVPQTSVEDLSFFDSQSIWTLFFPGKSYPTLQNEEIPHIKVEDQNSNALPQCMVGTLLERGFLINKKEFTPQVPFSHIVSNRMVGFVCNQNSLGFTWFRSSGLFRLSKWENLPEEKDGEKLYLLFENEAYDLLIQAEKVTYQNQFAIFQGKIGTESYKITATVSEFLSSKLIFVELSDALAKNSKLVYSFVPALGKNADRNIIFQAEDRFITMLGCRMDDITAGGFVFSDRPREAVASFDDRLNLTVLSGKETSFLLGGFSTQDHLNFLKRKICDLDLEEILSLEHDFYNAVFPAEVSREEFWISYQAIFSRFFGRTGLYQSSGAYGFRDQLQDSLVFLDHLPKKTKEHILRCAAHQFEEGDVLHWWHTTYSETKTSSGIRSRCSDDYLWLLFAVSEYLSTTGDREILTLPVPFLKGETLKDGEDERYFLPEKGSTAPLLEHLKRCVLLFIRRGLGINALPFIGCGDWNDGMNRIDGESVWLGFFGAICLHRTRDLFDDMTQKSIDSFLERLSKGLSSSHNGIWFVRAIREGGEVLGNCVSLEKECSIDLITQAFSAFYYLEFQNSTLELSEKCVKSALMASFEILFDEKHRILPLFTRPFQNTTPSPGYIQRYCAGVRENGGQYTHAAVWFCLALLEFGSQTKDDELMKAAKRVYEIINPFENIKLENFKRYQREPYVLCGDVYSADGFRGHGGWSWYTGAAAWYTRLMKRFRDLTKS